MPVIKLDWPLFNLPGIAPRFLRALNKLGIRTVRDLVWHFPSRYEDFRTICKICDLSAGQQATIQGIIRDINVRRSWRKNLIITEALISDETGDIKAIWFNQPYLINVLRPGRQANLAGKVMVDEEDLFLSHPAYELVSTVKALGAKHTGRLVPIYPETKGLTSKVIRFLIQPILKNLEKIEEWIPEEILAENNLPEINKALKTIHFPPQIDSANAARRRFSFEDLFLLQLYNIEQKLKLAKEKAPVIKADIEKLKKIITQLPFELTPSQKKSLWEIIQDLEKPKPMNRLLQGDVGSGKTVVAALAALIAVQNKLQAAFMAPTEILARQHYETIKKLFGAITSAYQAPIGLITSSEAKIFYENDLETEVKKPEFTKKIKSGEITILIGTHSLIQKSVIFKNLGLVIVDEQHRFGVKQRAQLLKQRDKKQALMPHLLSMSATPIPRTLMLTIFGDLDISTITELPAGRKEITTKIIAPENRPEAYKFIREKVKEGRQVFVICPRIKTANSKSQIASSETENPAATYKQKALWEVKSVKEEYEKLSKKIFPDLKVAMLHGQMKPKEKEEIMKKFKDGETDILVSTSVIEVGIDIPNAAIMMVEGADRFGLAQLYQFKGRVGRSEHQSYCFLFTDSSSKSTHERLKAITEAKNGFELAERDLKIRGPGEFLGEKQTGLPDIAMRGLQDIELIRQSRASALRLIEKNPTLSKYPLLKSKLSEFQEKVHLE